MKKYLLMAVAAIAALSSCTNGEDSILGDVTDNQGTNAVKPLVFTATMEDEPLGSRAGYDDAAKCAVWEEGDEISINGKTYVAQSSGRTTTFIAKTPGEEAEGPIYEAYFNCKYDGTTAELYNDFGYSDKDCFDMPMHARSEGGSILRFKNLCAVLAVRVPKSESENVDMVRVACATKRLSGEFDVVDDAAVLRRTDGNGYGFKWSVTMRCTKQVPGEDPVFYVPVPAGEYYSLQIVLLEDYFKGETKEKGMTTAMEKKITLERSNIYKVAFHKNATYAEKEGFVRTVQLWEGGPKWADFNYVYPSSLSDGRNLQGNLIDWDETAAQDLWGDGWILPTSSDYDDLLANCYGEWGIVNGVKGIWFIGKDSYSSNKVFFPNGEHMTRSTSGGGAAHNRYYKSLEVYYDGPGSESNRVETGGSQYVNFYVRPILAE